MTILRNLDFELFDEVEKSGREDLLYYVSASVRQREEFRSLLSGLVRLVRSGVPVDSGVMVGHLSRCEEALSKAKEIANV